VRFTTGVIRVETDRKHVTLPRVGTIKTHESTRKLARRLQTGTARILSATVRRDAGRWYCAFTVEVARHVSAPARPDATVGVDLGIKALAVLSTGEPVPNPRHLNRALTALRTASREVVAASRPRPAHRATTLGPLGNRPARSDPYPHSGH
jgi:putative transposase